MQRIRPTARQLFRMHTRRRTPLRLQGFVSVDCFGVSVHCMPCQPRIIAAIRGHSCKLPTPILSNICIVHIAFDGTRIWSPAVPGMPTTRLEFDAATALLCRVGAVSQAAARTRNAARYMSDYYSGLAFPELCDLINASRLIRFTPTSRRTSTASDVLSYFSPGSAIHVLGQVCLSVERGAMEAHLEYIWRHPDDFPRYEAFNAELYIRALRTSIGDMDAQPWALEEVRARLNATAADFEASKRDRKRAFTTWVTYGLKPPSGVTRSDERMIKSALKKGEWPAAVAQAFEVRASETARAIRHIVLWGLRTGTPGIKMPELSGGSPP